VLSLDQNSGIIEYLKETITIDALKQKLKAQGMSTSLLAFYRGYFKEGLMNARLNFCKSLAAYSLVCYLL
jgi:phosphatidylinositol 4-kinase B